MENDILLLYEPWCPVLIVTVLSLLLSLTVSLLWRVKMVEDSSQVHGSNLRRSSSSPLCLWISLFCSSFFLFLTLCSHYLSFYLPLTPSVPNIDRGGTVCAGQNTSMKYEVYPWATFAKHFKVKSAKTYLVLSPMTIEKDIFYLRITCKAYPSITEHWQKHPPNLYGDQYEHDRTVSSSWKGSRWGWEVRNS